MKLTIKEMCLCSMFSILIAVGAFIKIPISIVPITMQTLFVLLCGLVLGRKLAVLSVSLYICIGLLGLPVFANGGGLIYVLQPSFGYLLGFLLAAFLVGSYKSKVSSFGSILCLCIIGMFLIYGVGLAYFYMIQNIYFGKHVSFSWMFYYLFLVYIPGDLIACVIVTLLKQKIPHILQVS